MTKHYIVWHRDQVGQAVADKIADCEQGDVDTWPTATIHCTGYADADRRWLAVFAMGINATTYHVTGRTDKHS